MEIFFEGIILRPWTANDASQLSSIANNQRIGDNIRDGLPFPYTIKDAHDWLNIILPENNPPRFFSISIDNQIVGSIGIILKTNIYRKNFEIGFFLSENFWGRGIITRAVKAVTWYTFRNFDIVRVYAETFSDNTGSRRALEKAGFKLEATLRKSIIKNDIIKDSCIYSILKEDFKSLAVEIKV